jgi:hypothetical protein
VSRHQAYDPVYVDWSYTARRECHRKQATVVYFGTFTVVEGQARSIHLENARVHWARRAAPSSTSRCHSVSRECFQAKSNRACAALVTHRY